MAMPATVKKPETVLKKGIFWASIVFAIYEILFITGLLSNVVLPLMSILPGVRVFLYPQATLALHLGFLLALTFLLFSAGKDKMRKRIPWYDWILVAVALGWNFYLVINFDDVYYRTNTGMILQPWEVVTCFASFIILFEAARRTMGLAVAIVGACFLLYTIVGRYLPGILSGPNLSFERIARGTGMFVGGMYGEILNISATIIFAFIMFGVFLNLSGAGDWFLKISNCLFGRIRGGSSKTTILANALMGMVQGSAAAIVASVGVLTIPLMKKTGYTPTMAAAIEAAAANGGQIMPPVMGIAAFIMVDFMGVGYDKIMLAGLIPALIYYLSLYFQSDFEAGRAGLKGMSASETPRFKATFREGWFYLLPIIILLVMLLYFNWSAQMSAVIATTSMIVITWFKKSKRLGIKQIAEGLKTTSTSMVLIAVMCALAGLIVATVNVTGLSFRLSGLLIAVSGGNMLVLLVLTAVVAIILGMGMPTSAVYVVLATLVAPALVSMGVQPMAAHMFLFYFGVMALLTPPVCPASFIAAALADSPPMKTGWTATRLAIAGFLVPFVFVYKPDMLLQGNILMGIWNGVEATILTFALVAGIAGYLMRPLKTWQRVVMLAAGLIMLYPYSWMATAGGIALVLIPTAMQAIAILNDRRMKPRPSEA